MKVVTFFNNKGGVGKTTTIINLASYLSIYREKKVLVVDLCIFRKNCASVPEERSAIPLQTEQSSAG